MTLVATMLALVAPAPADVCHTLRCHERVAAKRCAHGQVVACIDRGAIRWHVSAAMLRRKAWCESRFNPLARNVSSAASGLFQFLPSTWLTTPYRWRSIWSAKWSSLAAGWMHAAGRGGEWACA
jgi:soluble lytic murein transglycosylase-like protein